MENGFLWIFVTHLLNRFVSFILSWLVLPHFPLVLQLSKCWFLTFRKKEVEYQRCLIMICILCNKDLGWLPRNILRKPIVYCQVIIKLHFFKIMLKIKQQKFDFKHWIKFKLFKYDCFVTKRVAVYWTK